MRKQDSGMDRQAALASLLCFDRPLNEIEALRGLLGWGEEPLVTPDKEDIASVLGRYLAGEIDAATVEEWANLIEGRDDIEFASPDEEIIIQAIHDLANPMLQGSLVDIAPDVLAALTRKS